MSTEIELKVEADKAAATTTSGAKGADGKPIVFAEVGGVSGIKKSNMILTPQWDYCVMFADVEPPTKKEKGADGVEKEVPVPESDGKYKKWAEMKEKRKAVVEELRRPQAGLTISTKKSGNRLFVLISASEKRLMLEAERIEFQVKLKAEYGGGYDDFERRKLNFYEPAVPVKGEDKAPSFFRRLQRMKLIESIITARHDDGGCELVISKLLKTGVISKFYGLHDEYERLDMVKTWPFRKPWVGQDINRIRDYFGEEVAFYFAWLSFKTQRLFWAALGGILVFALWVAGGEINNDPLKVWPLTIYSLFLGVWAALFQNYWARLESTLAFRWGVLQLEDVETIRPEYVGDESREGLYYNGEWIEFTNSETNTLSAALSEIVTGENPNDVAAEQSKAPLAVNVKIQRQPYYSAVRRNGKYTVAIPILVFFLCVVIVCTFSVLTFRLFLQRTLGEINSGLTVIGSVLGGVLNAIVIIFLNQVYQRLALKLTEWENHRTYSQFANNLTFKMFMMQFINSYTSLYYMSFFKRGTHLWGSDNQAVWDACKQGDADPNIIGWGCIDEVFVQMLTLMLVAITIGNFKQVFLPWLIGKIKTSSAAKKGLDPEAEKAIPQYEREATKVDWPGVFDEYNEMAVQYGFITLFAAAFPLAPVLGWINCMIQLRSDSFKLLTSFNKPHFRTAGGIGTWRMIFETLGVVAIITNCALICFSYPTLLTAVQNSMGVDKDDDLAWKAAFATFGIMVIVEHIMIVLKYAIDVLIPDTPGQIRKLLAKSEFIKNETFRELDNETLPASWEPKKMLFSDGKDEPLATDQL